MPAVGAPRSFEKKFKFTIEIDGITHAGFQKCSELAAEAAKIEYREGGALIPNKSPGLVTFDDLTLERGAVASDSDLYNWFTEVVDVAANTGLIDNDYKRDLDIVLSDRDGTELKRWRVVNAWIQKFTAGAWDNEADEVTMEMVVLTYDYFTRVTG